jgi:hypothetical protein
MVKIIQIDGKWAVVDKLFDTKEQAEKWNEDIKETLQKACKIVYAYENLPETQKARVDTQMEFDAIETQMNLPEGWEDTEH